MSDESKKQELKAIRNWVADVVLPAVEEQLQDEDVVQIIESSDPELLPSDAEREHLVQKVLQKVADRDDRSVLVFRPRVLLSERSLQAAAAPRNADEDTVLTSGNRVLRISPGVEQGTSTLFVSNWNDALAVTIRMLGKIIEPLEAFDSAGYATVRTEDIRLVKTNNVELSIERH